MRMNVMQSVTAPQSTRIGTGPKGDCSELGLRFSWKETQWPVFLQPLEPQAHEPKGEWLYASVASSDDGAVRLAVPQNVLLMITTVRVTNKEAVLLQAAVPGEGHQQQPAVGGVMAKGKGGDSRRFGGQERCARPLLQQAEEVGHGKERVGCSTWAQRCSPELPDINQERNGQDKPDIHLLTTGRGYVPERIDTYS
ncbi:26S Proteasome Non-Atpase Regulatory Subunit 6 [Manis pentadactyla]|nr:26S Proteasome Non-Atpase Regulatory Subunit 6 [Manis pentadactyla]